MKGKKKKKPAVIPVVIALSILFAALAAGLFTLYVAPWKNQQPVYEEEYVSSSKFRSTLTKVDHLVYESLYREGVKEEDILFSKVIPKHEKNRDWDFTELTIRLKRPDLVKRLESVIPKRISDLSPDVIIESEKISSDQAVYIVTVFGCITHRLNLKYKAGKKEVTGKLPRVGFIIDDIGYDVPLARAFMELKIPVCLSVLPYAPYSRKIAAETVKKGGELLLHLPMEPKNYPEVNPGKGALMVNMDRETIQSIVRKQILKFPGLKGVNHHMGSLFTEDYIKMKNVLDEVKRHDLYYIDSRTTNRTVAYRVARELGVPAAEKKWFIDNDLSEKALKYQMDRLLGVARYSGSAIGIGHPHRETLDILKKYSELLLKNYEVVPVSELVE
jgi:polysaccharide deacetylase 2 family uncharacterized protein YibQ